MTEEWVRHVVIGELQDFKLAERQGIRLFSQKWCKASLLRKDYLRKLFKEQVGALHLLVKTNVQSHLRLGGKFALSADSWKAKSRCQVKNFLAVNCHWVSFEGNWTEFCVNVTHIDDKSKSAEGYASMLSDVMQTLGLTNSDFTMAIADHEGALRKALDKMEIPVLGCQCHFLQLPPKHVLPPLKHKAPKKKKKPAQKEVAVESEGEDISSTSSDSSDSDSSSSDNSSDSETNTAVGQNAPVEHPRLEKTDPTRVQLMKDSCGCIVYI